ncbi:probable cytosol aminopeptidase [Buchnera aphidicola (Nipponaphis monzeni)]|uniref:Probable cytosol aminopeptidase n=1 Tax=Buchnera aphidicola (Nipponaphis monzeni) TaxID=2495405 RepID=A0A455TAH2_9GAMM|nr:leucyl aminopeptidase [Buchnera aphidicola]BBI01290.1 probable cytosol aminopeptidase [Buchnera aphidicola (Nipponaphis monzeni)]
MNFLAKNCNLKIEKSDCIILAIFETNDFSESAKELDIVSKGYLSKILNYKDFNGNIGESLLLYNVPYVSCRRVLLIGCGKRLYLSTYDYKKILQSFIIVLKKITAKIVLICLTELFVYEQDIYWKIRIIIEHITSVNYFFDEFKSYKKNRPELFKELIINVSTEIDSKIGVMAIKHALAISLGIKAAKNLANTPPNVCTPSYLANQVINLSKQYSKWISHEVINYEKIIKLGMFAYAAVGQGSSNKPLMININYKGKNPINSKPIILIGKGVTFDSGGISIKPSSGLHEMKYDMSGASVVYGIMLILAELQLPLRVIGVLATGENMLGDSSFRPGDIIKTMSGKTVEILDTDAEGRLILCDVLTFVEKFSPELVIDIATLTGACVIALGNIASGLLSNDQLLIQELLEASEITNDKVWNLPMFTEYFKKIKSNIADISNIGGNSAGAITAACFLSKFAKKYRWAHLDIAGTAWTSGKKMSSTGRPILLLMQFLMRRGLTNTNI